MAKRYSLRERQQHLDAWQQSGKRLANSYC